MTHSDLFIAWLNDAYTLEKSIAGMLGAQIGLAANLPMVQRRLQDHLDETQEHAKVVRKCLEALGASISAGHEIVTFPTKHGSRPVPRKLDDDLLRSAMFALSSEALEIAIYTALIVAADDLGYSGMASRFETILAQERAMASWIEEDLPLLASEALLRFEVGDSSPDSAFSR
jgi:ferritin-like metal-binding protein YciE